MTGLKKFTGISLAALLSVSTAVPALAQMQQTQPGDAMVTPMTSQVVIPAGTVLTVEEKGFASDPGEMFRGELINPVRVNGQVVIPAGSTVMGSVVNLDPAANTRDIQLNTLNTPAGNQVAFESRVTTNLPAAGVAAVRQDPLTGRVQAGSPVQRGLNTIYPRISIGGDQISPAAKVLAGTAGGALFGAATGTLTGLTMAAVYDDEIDISLGNSAARGLAWGSAYGAGLGLISGLIAAAATHQPAAVSTTAPATTVGYQPAGQVYDIVVAQPITIGM